MRLAYADPPYLGQCHRYGHRHDPPWGCWDDLDTHRALISQLELYDGWALSASANSAGLLAAMMDMGDPAVRKGTRVRMAAWVKPFAAAKRNVRVAYTWEPVFFRTARLSTNTGAPVTRDHLACPITVQRGLTGAKPERFCRWVLDLLGYLDGDTVDDLFPGTEGMARTRAQGVLL